MKFVFLDYESGSVVLEHTSAQNNKRKIIKLEVAQSTLESVRRGLNFDPCSFLLNADLDVFS